MLTVHDDSRRKGITKIRVKLYAKDEKYTKVFASIGLWFLFPSNRIVLPLTSEKNSFPTIFCGYKTNNNRQSILKYFPRASRLPKKRLNV